VGEQLLPEGLEKSVVRWRAEVRVGPRKRAVLPLLEEEGDLLPNPLAAVEPVGVVLGRGENDAAIIDESGIDVHGPLDGKAPARLDLLFHAQSDVLDLGQAVLGPGGREDEELPEEARTHASGISAGLGKGKSGAFPAMVEGAKLFHDELFGPGKEGFKTRDDAKEEEGGRRFSKGLPSHGLLVMQDSAITGPLEHVSK